MHKSMEPPESFFKMAKNEIFSFFSESTIPGLKYVVESRVLVERVAWAILLSLAFYGTATIINKQWADWRSNPVETTIDEMDLPVDLLPFPAITVCDTESLKMPRKNRWMFVEKLLNSLQLDNPKEELKRMFPSKFSERKALIQ